MLDTGATASFISVKLAESPEITGQRVAIRRRVKLVNGSHTKTRTAFQAQISFGNKTKTLNLLVMPGMVDSLVLGWDFLNEFGATVTCAGHRVTIPKRERWGGCLEDRLSVAMAGCPEEWEEGRIKRFIKRELEAFQRQANEAALGSNQFL
ncbi:uncharacterized protein [Drosophila bipectinata]|uniref:uncharacterized protein n=1 Tax=Drosophila bipectinata TaxID=42026 RepID=UPI0038B260EC